MLETKSFDAVIEKGQIQHAENLGSWEGREVQVTVHIRPAPEHFEENVDEVPEGIDVERDVYVKMPAKTTILATRAIRDLGPARPSIILPEGIEDE